ncbi:MAG: Uma2 family endonuclease [Ktedonobacteraceae bacterium]|nr:Uma2 family endonuclease [Ktedonobacteraceae bacterium]
MVAQRGPQYMTVTEWRELERTSHDIKHEYIDGQVYAMSGGSLAHGRIGSNAVRILEDALATARKPCNVYNSDVATRLSARRYTYPDVSVTCDERDRPAPDKTEVQAPHVIVEVLSDSTEAYDRGRKFSFYRACPTVQEYVLVATRYQAVEVYRRTPQGWAIYQSYGPGDEIELTSLEIHFPLTALYKNAGVLEALEDPEGEV